MIASTPKRADRKTANIDREDRDEGGGKAAQLGHDQIVIEGAKIRPDPVTVA